VTRLSLRLRLTLAFAVAMALVLTAVAVILYVRLGATLAEGVDDSLEARASAIAATGFRSLGAGTGDGLAQLIGPNGQLVASARVREPMLDTGELVRARAGPVFLRRGAVAALEGEPVRLLAVPAGDSVLVVGATLEEREEALAGLLRELLVVLPLALVVAAAGGYVLATAALRPVEAMRRRAAEITSADPSQRLPLPASGDEIARLGATLNEMLGRLEDGLERERRFVADASHELRTPLALLRTELELALRRPRTPAELEAAIGSAAAETERLSRLAENLLVLATAGRGGLPLQIEELELDELVETVTRRFTTRAATEGRVLAPMRSGARVVGDRLRLEQALGNLVDNALRHGRGTVAVQAEIVAGTVELRVTDEGNGVPAELGSHAFEPFARADTSRSHEGAGLGLAIVDAVARAHGGAARIDGDAADGARVVLSIPADASKERELSGGGSASADPPPETS